MATNEMRQAWWLQWGRVLMNAEGMLMQGLQYQEVDGRALFVFSRCDVSGQAKQARISLNINARAAKG